MVKGAGEGVTLPLTSCSMRRSRSNCFLNCSTSWIMAFLKDLSYNIRSSDELCSSALPAPCPVARREPDAVADSCCCWCCWRRCRLDVDEALEAAVLLRLRPAEAPLCVERKLLSESLPVCS